MNDEERKNWEIVKKGQKPDKELTKNWKPPRLEGEQYLSDIERSAQFKNAYLNSLNEMNKQFGTNARLINFTNNGNGSYTVTTFWPAQDMQKYRKNPQAIDNFLDNQIQQKLNQQKNLSNQNLNIKGQQDISSPKPPASPTPFHMKPKNPGEIR